VELILSHPELFNALIDGMTDPDPVVRMRCADATQKIAVNHPEYLLPHKKRLIDLAATALQQETRWHLAQMMGCLTLNAAERRHVADILITYLDDNSRIVKTFAMQTLADIASRDPELAEPIINRLRELTRTGTPAMRSRGHALLERFK
jgi:hypothetical protein